MTRMNQRLVDIIRPQSMHILALASQICMFLNFHRCRREPDVGSFRFQLAVVDCTFRFGTVVPRQF